MDKSELIISICLVTVLILLLTVFMLFMLFWQRAKSNRFINERETMKAIFNEQLLRSQLEIQEQSFNTISMEIHDNVGQTLSLLKVQLNIMDQKKTLDKVLLGEAKDNVGKAMSDLRDIAKSLSSERIQLLSLSEMTKHELQRISNTGIMQVSHTTDGHEQIMTSEKKLILFRIIQESFQNIIKHANATKVTVDFVYYADNLRIEINDNGKGFDNEISADKPKGLGLQNIVNRAAIIGGKAIINSGIDIGTTIIIITPYE
jgi:two-component system NarL family sensor kinase